VFLDRDGVLVRPVVVDGKPVAPRSLEEFEIYPEAPAACDELRALGYRLVVVTNQPDVARGTVTARVVTSMHDLLSSRLDLDAIYVCTHDDVDRCSCRKPAPGMLVRATEDFGLDLSACVVVGDRWRDAEAGQRAGCRTVHIDRGYSERPPTRADAVVGSLAEAVKWIENMGFGGG